MRRRVQVIMKGASIAVAASLMTAACSPSGKNTESTASSTAGASSSTAGASKSSTASGSPIKIGIIVPTGAQFYNDPGGLAVTQAAVRGINARGCVKGRPLTLEVCNEANDPNKTNACARQFVSDGVLLTVGAL